MDITQILPNIGAPVSSPAFDEAAAAEMSVGEAAYAAAFFLKVYAQKMADPATAFAQFTHERGADWSGLQSDVAEQSDPAASSAGDELPLPEDGMTTQDEPAEQPRHIPVAPDNYYDTMPAIAHMLRQQQAALDAAVTHFAAHLAPAIDHQQAFLGAPVGVKAYRDGATYFREVLKISGMQTKKIYARVPYVTWTPGIDASLTAFQPKMPQMAESFAEGNISGDNLDRIVGLDQDLTKYVRKTKALPEDKANVMAAFEPALVDAAETATPDELSKAKTRWADKIAHALDADGPSVAEAIRKRADNAIRTRDYADGSGLISIHADAPNYAQFKNWSLHQMNRHGTPVQVPPHIIDLLRTDTEDGQEPTAAETFSDFNNLETEPNPEACAEDADGNTVAAEDLHGLDVLSTGQRLAAILVGMFHTMLSMDPTELGAKSAHGTTAQLLIVQDIQTAYETLGVGALPEAVRRPPGPAGVLPPVRSQPNPTDRPPCFDPTHTRGHAPPPWTPYLSEAINIGAFHPKHAEQLACDSKLVGQIWNGHHEVLAQHRAKRLFTPTQRRAILARDRGCQAPGCTIPAVYCQIHHITEWLHGGTTDVDNAITLCAHHHAAVHHDKWTIRKRHGITFFQPAPWLDPTQPFLRNLYWSI